jgi:RimJ/RimL family protein N-acetyltransferase
MIVTPRLQLVPATPDTVRAALAGPEPLGRALRVAVPPTWPPEYLDDEAFRYTLARLGEGPNQAAWGLHFAILAIDPRARTLIGTAGYKGPPSADGTVEVGYGIVSDQRRKGLASEAVMGLLGRAFSQPEVARVIAETLPELVGSIGVLTGCGFRLIGDGSEPGVIRYELPRAAYVALRSTQL